MSDEAAIKLAEAISKLADAINAIPRDMLGGIRVTHHGQGFPSNYPQPTYWRPENT